LSDRSNSAIGNLRSEELADFLTTAKGSTFAFVKILGDDLSCFYLIALWDKNCSPKVIKEEKLPSNLAIKNDIQKNNVAAQENIWPPPNGICLGCGKDKEADVLFCQSCQEQQRKSLAPA